MAPHSSTLAWKIPWMEEPGRLQSMGSLESDMAERLHFHFSLSCIGEGNGNPLQCSCLENPRDGGAWWAAVYGVAQSRTRLKRLSSSSSALTCGFFSMVNTAALHNLQIQRNRGYGRPSISFANFPLQRIDSSNWAPTLTLFKGQCSTFHGSIISIFLCIHGIDLIHLPSFRYSFC